MKQAILFGIVASIFLAMTLFLAISLGSATSLDTSNIPDKHLDPSKITTSWNLSFLFENKDEARATYQDLNLGSEQINKTFRPKFDNLTGRLVLEYIQEDENFSKSLSVLYAYAFAKNSLNVNDKFYEAFLSDVQNLSTEHEKATSFADIKLKSLPKSEWEKLFAQEPGLNEYRPYLESNYIRYYYHRPRNESHAAYITDLSNQLMKLDAKAAKIITNNATRAGNITLSNGAEREINSQSYYEILSTDIDRINRNKCYDKRYYHLFNESKEMGAIYV